MPCPREVAWPDVGNAMLLVCLEPAPQDVQFWGASDEAPALGSLLNTAVEAEEQEDVAGANVLLVEVPLGDAGLAEHAPPSLPAGASFALSVRVEVEVGVEVVSVPSVQAAVGDAGDDAGDVDVAVLQVIELLVVSGRDGQ